MTSGLEKNWSGFVSIVLVPSGVEAIADTTSVMKLDLNSTHDKPSVTRRTATPVILWVTLKMCFLPQSWDWECTRSLRCIQLLGILRGWT